jgi:hypothetical protein
MFRKRDLFLSSGEGEGHIYSVGSIRKVTGLRLALSKGPNRVDVSPTHLRTETDPLSETVFSNFWNIGRWTNSKNPVIMKMNLVKTVSMSIMMNTMNIYNL